VTTVTTYLTNLSNQLLGRMQVNEVTQNTGAGKKET